ncbi:MAG: PepSY domain-containing protein [Pseudomonadota bacterium]
MTFQRGIVLVHKWVALIIGIQIFLWICGGLVMSAIPIEIVHGEHKIAAPAPATFSVDEIVPLETAMSAASFDTVKAASLGEVLGAPVWRLTNARGQTVTISAATGEALSPISESFAREIALSDYSGSGALARVTLVDEPPSEYGRAGPVWQARFDDRDATTLYIDPTTATVRARRSTTWRFYDFFWKLHVMDYDDGASFNHPLLITAAGAGLVAALAGLILLVLRMRVPFIRFRRFIARNLGREKLS